jgi:hypothetical protein
MSLVVGTYAASSDTPKGNVKYLCQDSSKHKLCRVPLLELPLLGGGNKHRLSADKALRHRKEKRIAAK